MLRAAENLVQRLPAMSRDRLEADAFEQYGVSKALELIGEAASRVSLEFRAAHPELPWKKIIGMRNVLVHDYQRVDWVRIWTTVEDDVPGLLTALRALLPPAPETG
ncbi:MAG TPA: HepT-like ribonuclease domain-containing protein [Longimicrobium sp.]|nr:HepT-like ribonuclease domain-containing protein [Longimicrobium sp.]